MIVVHASAMLELLLGTAVGRACRRHLVGDGEDLRGLQLLDVELAQVLRRFSAEGEIIPERSTEALADLLNRPLTRYPHEPLLERACELREAVSLDDAVSLALADALKAPLVTSDARTARAHGRRAQVQLLQ